MDQWGVHAFWQLLQSDLLIAEPEKLLEASIHIVQVHSCNFPRQGDGTSFYELEEGCLGFFGGKLGHKQIGHAMQEIVADVNCPDTLERCDEVLQKASLEAYWHMLSCCVDNIFNLDQRCLWNEKRVAISAVVLQFGVGVKLVRTLFPR